MSMRHLPHILAVVSVLVAISGCASEKHADKRDEVAEVPDAYGYELEGIETDGWCSDFGSENLDDMVAEAWEENLELKAAWARLEQAKAQAAQTRAELLPELRAEAGVTVSNEAQSLPETIQDGNGDGAAVGARYEAALAASYEVDLWGRLRHRARAAKLEAKAVEREAQALAMTLTSRVAAAWLDVVAARERLALLDEQIEVSKEILELTRNRFRQGLADEIDIIQQRQNLESLRGERVDARLAVETNRHRLAVLTGREPGTDLEIAAEKLPQVPPLPDPGVPADLLKRRPDIRGALLQLKAADQQTAAAVADRLPRLELSASLFLQAGQIGQLLDRLIWSAAANASQAIYEGGRLEAAVDEAESAAEERLYLYGQTLLEALEDVRNAMVGGQRQQERIASLKREVGSAEQALEAARSQYREGAADYFRVLDALQRLQALERQLIQASRRRLSFRIGLCRAIGGSWATDMESPL